MPSEFDFLRIKWPKLAAIASDAARLVESSPSSCIASVKLYCEWVADICLDLYGVYQPDGASQFQRIEALRATGRVPSDILDMLEYARNVGKLNLQDNEENLNLSRQCIEDMMTIGHWLFKEADSMVYGNSSPNYRSSKSFASSPAIPPRSLPTSRPSREPSERQVINPRPSYQAGSDYEDHSIPATRSMLFHDTKGSNRSNVSRIISYVSIGVILVALIVLIALTISKCTGGDDIPANTITPDLSSQAPTEEATDTLEPSSSPEPEIKTQYVETITPDDDSTIIENYSAGAWTSRVHEGAFQVDSKKYDHGIGIFVPTSAISEDRATQYLTYTLDGSYRTLSFLYGTDDNFGGDKTKMGNYRLIIEADGNVVYQSGIVTSKYVSDPIEVDIQNCTKLKISLTAYKGDEGTANVVLADLLLSDAAPTATTSEASPTPNGDDSASASPTGDSATASPTPPAE